MIRRWELLELHVETIKYVYLGKEIKPNLSNSR